MDATPAVLPARHLDMLPLIRRTSGLAEAHQPIHASQRGHRPGPGAFAGPGVNMHVEWENGRGSAKGKGEETRATKESNLEGGKSGCFSRVLQRYLASPASTAVVSRKSTRADRPLTHTLTPHGGKLSGCSAMTTSQPSSPSLPLPPLPPKPPSEWPPSHIVFPCDFHGLPWAIGRPHTFGLIGAGFSTAKEALESGTGGLGQTSQPWLDGHRLCRQNHPGRQSVPRKTKSRIGNCPHVAARPDGKADTPGHSLHNDSFSLAFPKFPIATPLPSLPLGCRSV